jgi:HD-GYP domain-containing protein (c-di-GMP phosphodiesterase class II)
MNNDVSGPGGMRLSEVLSGLSYALDLTEGQRPGHAVRSCLIGMRLAQEINLPYADRSALFYALLMKDLGCSSNAARFAALFGANDHDVKNAIQHINWAHALEAFRLVARNAAPGQPVLKRIWRLLALLAHGPEGPREVVRTRCERGADIARLLRLEDATAAAIRALDEHWDGHGQPYSLKRDEIPMLARVLGLAQTVEVFFTSYGITTAYDMARARRGTWFDPDLVDALLSMESDSGFWRRLGGTDHADTLRAVEPADRVIVAGEADIDRVAEAFARVIDAKSPWTYQHSSGVATTAVAIGERLGYGRVALRELRRSALLHDLGKLGVSNLILDKPGKLTDPEFAAMRKHSRFTYEILTRVPCFQPFALSASSHHERLDGRGYHRGVSESALSTSSRVLCVADIFDALRSSRPYRTGLPVERVLDIMGREVGTALDPACFDALRAVVDAPVIAAPPEVPAARLVSALSEDYHQAA